MRKKRPKTRKPGRALKYPSAVCVRGLPRGHGGGISLLNVSFLEYWNISWQRERILENGRPKCLQTPEKARASAEAIIYRFILLPWVCAISRGHLVAEVSVVS